MLKHYFLLQYRRCNRALLEFGLPPLVGYIFGIVLFFGASVFLFYKTKYAAYLYVIIALLIILQASEQVRNDNLKLLFLKKQYRQIRYVENLLIASPFMLFLVFQKEGLIGLGLFLFAILFSFYSRGGTIQKVIPTPFSRHPFEFIVGFRKTFLMVVALYCLAIIGISVDNFNLGAVVLLGLNLVCLTYYGDAEHPHFVWLFRVPPSTFLLQKIKMAAWHSTILCLPMTLGLAAFFPSQIWLLLLILLLGYIYIATMILAKYAAFPQNINLPQGILLACGLWIPPMLLGIIPYFYKKSIQRLKNILE